MPRKTSLQEQFQTGVATKPKIKKPSLYKVVAYTRLKWRR